jgi:hypothetical protein
LPPRYVIMLESCPIFCLSISTAFYVISTLFPALFSVFSLTFSRLVLDSLNSSDRLHFLCLQRKRLVVDASHRYTLFNPTSRTVSNK